MEWVQGKRITDYADSHNLTIRLRLQLFIRVCKAVQYAHEKGIIHRDIKPSNILVAEENGEPLPKVIDFGIAKAMDVNEGTTTSINTRTGQLIGTPAYMSPEQASGNGTKIDKRSDIYSLGVLLYELLTGFGPLQLDALSLYHQLRAICDDDPELASEKVASLSATETLRIATTRSTQATQVIMELRSGVDAIVMRCLKKKAEDRYDTVTTLAADIAKWIDGHSKAVEPSEVASGCVKGMDSGLACLIAVVILVAVTVLVQSYNVPPPVVVKAPTPTNYLDKMKQQLLQWANYVRTNTFPQLTNLPTNPEKTIPHQAASLTKQDVERGDSVLAKTIDEIHGQQRQSLDSDDVATPNALLAKTIDAIE
jgi:serine/threonine protein kinase